MNVWNRLYRAQLNERLARIHEARGDMEDAAEHYTRFLALLAEAEPELQGLLIEVRDRLRAARSVDDA